MTNEALRKPLDPIALSVADEARLLSKVGAPTITTFELPDAAAW